MKMLKILCDAVEHAKPTFGTNRHGAQSAKRLGSCATFYLLDGDPYVVFPDWDYAECWGRDAIREVHPFVPVIHGKEIDRAEFRAQILKADGI